MEWHNKMLLNRIKSAKSKINTNTKTVKCLMDTERSRHRIQQQLEIDNENEQIAQKLAKIYGRKSRY